MLFDILMAIRTSLLMHVERQNFRAADRSSQLVVRWNKRSYGGPASGARRRSGTVGKACRPGLGKRCRVVRINNEMRRQREALDCGNARLKMLIGCGWENAAHAER